MTAPLAPEVDCQHCHLPIEPVDGPGKKYGFRHTESKRISCWDVYKPEIATPASQLERN